jgi:hypothetical protein
MLTQHLGKKSMFSLLAIGLLALLIVGLLVGASRATSNNATVAPSQSSSESSQFSVLEPADSVVASEVPSGVSELLTHLPSGEDGESTDEVSSLGMPPSQTPSSQVVLAEVGKKLCVFASGDEYQGAVLGNCFPVAAAEAGEGYVVVQGLPDDSARVIGVAPDAVKSVSIDVGANGSTDERVSTTGNIYQVDLDAPVPVDVTGLSSTGDIQFQTDLPISGKVG